MTNAELDAIAGRREQLVGRIQEIYRLEPAEAERQLRNWERNLALEEFDETELTIEDEDTDDLDGRG